MSRGNVSPIGPPGAFSSSRSIILAVGAVVAVFLGDFFVPLGIAGGVLYVVAILLVVWLAPLYVYGFAAACTALTVIGYFISPETGERVIDLANRGVSVFAVWTVAFLGLHLRSLSESVHQHGQIIDQVQDAVITVDMAGTIDYWNLGAEEVFGYAASEIVGRSISRVYATGEAEVTRSEIVGALLDQGSIEIETDGVRRSGQAFVMRQWILLRRDDGNEPAGLIIQVSDVTTRREAEKAATRLEALYQNILDELPLQVAIFDPAGHFLYLNPASLASQEKRDWIIGRTEMEYFQHVGRNIEAARQRDFHRLLAIQERRKVVYEEEFVTWSGEVRSFSHGFYPIVGEDGDILRVLGFRYDITDHKRTEWALRESLARLKAVVDTAGDGILTIDAVGGVESCNQAAQRMFGFQPSVAIGKDVDTLIKAADSETPGGFLENHLDRIPSVSEPKIGEFLAVKQDGTMFPVEVATSRLELGEQHLFTAIVRDLTNRKRSERALVRYAERLEAFRQMDQAILTAVSAKDVAKVAVDHLGRLIPAGTVCIALFDNAQGAASVLTVQCEGLKSKESTVSIGDFLGTQTQSEVQNRIAEACENGHVAMLNEKGRQSSDEAIIAVPLTIQDGVIGMLKLEAKSGTRFVPEDIDIAKEVAGVLAIAINDARLFEEVDASRERLRGLSNRLVEVQEQERRLIARELHDEIGQALTGLKFLLENLEGRGGLENLEQIEESRRITLQLLARVRDLSLDLRPAMLDDLGLLPALLWLTERYSTRTGVDVRFKHSGLEDRLDPEIETAAYRIVQEALTNVARHAGRAQVDIVLFVLGDMLTVRVRDDGAGFNVKEALARKNSSGLSGMYERANLLGGTLEVQSEIGNGTTISAAFPLTSSDTVEMTP